MLNFYLPPTLEYKINVPVRLLISQIFSHQYAFISDGTFIEIGIFWNLILWTFGKNFKKYSKIFKELLEFILWNVMIGIGLYIECNCKVFSLKFCWFLDATEFSVVLSKSEKVKVVGS